MRDSGNHRFLLLGFCLASAVLTVLIMTRGGSSVTARWRLVMADTLNDAPSIKDLSFMDPRQGWAITPAVLWETTDGGQTWKEQLKANDEVFCSLRFINQTSGWIASSQLSAGGSILRTRDGGKTWLRYPVKALTVIESMSFCNSNAGLAIGNNVIIHTVDEGETWETQYHGDDQDILFDVTCISPERAWVVGSDGIILHTTDGGRKWDHQDSKTKSWLRRVRFFGDKGWIVGNDGTILQTQDGGATWEPQKAPVSATLLDIYVDDLQGWAIGEEGIILHTNDGGRSWQRQMSPTKNTLESLSFFGHQGWAGGSRRTLLHYSE